MPPPSGKSCATRADAEKAQVIPAEERPATVRPATVGRRPCCCCDGGIRRQAEAGSSITASVFVLSATLLRAPALAVLFALPPPLLCVQRGGRPSSPPTHSGSLRANAEHHQRGASKRPARGEGEEAAAAAATARPPCLNLCASNPCRQRRPNLLAREAIGFP